MQIYAVPGVFVGGIYMYHYMLDIGKAFLHGTMDPFGDIVSIAERNISVNSNLGVDIHLAAEFSGAYQVNADNSRLRASLNAESTVLPTRLTADIIVSYT